MSWESAQSSWNAFLAEVEGARCELYCSVSNAWFRGVENSSWDLTTSLFRHEHRADSDTQKTITRAESALGQAKKNLAKRRWKREAETLNKRLQVLRSLHYGEREAFTEFAFRAGHSTTQSWEILAEMQHYRTPTRLLDWTEVLAIAVYFALKTYISELLKVWEPEHGRGFRFEARADGQLPFYVPIALPTPRVWILNPYRLSRLARKENALWDPTKDRRYDYFESFFVNHNWEFDLPVPLYVPWKDRRIAAQRAMFTVQGLDTRPLNIQLGADSDALRFVDLPPEAAVYGVRHLMSFLGLNTFAIFQDLDSLGNEIKRHFIIPNIRQRA
jgi:hypothetical protein